MVPYLLFVLLYHELRSGLHVALPYRMVRKTPPQMGGAFCVYPGVGDLAVAYFYLDTRAHGGANGD